MAKSKSRVSDVKADQATEEMKRRVICPLTLEATTKISRDPNAVNYGLTWEATIAIDESEEPGVWYSSQKSRGHTEAFEQLLAEKKESEEITWEEDGFYFSQEEGEKAREVFEKMALDGETTLEIDGEEVTIITKANKKSWDNKHSEFTGVSWEQLCEMHPEIYSSSTSKKTEVTEETEEDMPISQEQVEAEEDLAEDAAAEEETELQEDSELVATAGHPDEDDDDEDEEEEDELVEAEFDEDDEDEDDE